jgi:hypothetical protein
MHALVGSSSTTWHNNSSGHFATAWPPGASKLLDISPNVAKSKQKRQEKLSITIVADFEPARV